jgi:hypothetical protein
VIITANIMETIAVNRDADGIVVKIKLY